MTTYESEQGQGQTLDLEFHIAASPETVFSFFVDPVKYRRWKGSEAELDPRPGGIYKVVMPSRDVVLGEYVEVDPPRRVIFTWGFEGSAAIPPGSTTVEVTFQPGPQPETTLVHLRHRGLPDENARAEHGIGWSHFLERLAIAAPGGDPGPDRPS
jgi:uncharacterized protein YndB with AHSA1/START domain